jgi:hypothetical protein
MVLTGKRGRKMMIAMEGSGGKWRCGLARRSTDGRSESKEKKNSPLWYKGAQEMA